ncbi:unnamed protein product [Durusdinium trenchii]|uniref:Uncharacterized protein n=1 Tax=Durusdinium trenchii TaxID=1381693 RepID=A0ABP0NB03_9DINO
MKQSNWLKAVGVSNFAERHLIDLQQEGLPAPAVHQLEFHPAWPRVPLETAAPARAVGTIMQAYGCLGGAHTGAMLLQLELVQQIAQHHEHLKELIRQRVKWEGRLMVVLPVVPLLSSPWTTCTGGMPTWAYIIYLPFLLKAKVTEAVMLQKLQSPEYIWSLEHILGFWLWGPLEHLDPWPTRAGPAAFLHSFASLFARCS